MSEKPCTILGIDPGTKVTGYGIVQTDGQDYTLIDFGCIRPRPALSLHVRFGLIHEGIATLLNRYSIDALSVETQFIGRNVQSALKLGMARAVAILAATRENIPVYEYSPRKAKLSIVGTGGATKDQVKKMVQTLLNLKDPPQPEDAADALALALCHAHSIKAVPCLNT